MDEGPGTVIGINFDQKTGNMSIAWGPEEMKTFGWINAIGPPDHRVLIGTNMKLENESNIQPGPKNPNYSEQVMWRDAATEFKDLYVQEAATTSQAAMVPNEDE